MVIADLNINVIGNRKVELQESICKENIAVEINKFPLRNGKCRYDEWQVYSYIIGSNVTLYPFDENDEIIEMFELSSVQNFCVVIYEKYYSFIENFIKYLIDQSPINKIVVLFRLQADDKEKYTGEISLNSFMKKLREEKIRYNQAYIVRNSRKRW